MIRFDAFISGFSLFASTLSPMKIRLDQMASPTRQCHTAMASEAFTLKTLGTSLLMHDKDDINYTCVLQYWYYLGLVVFRRAET